MDPFELADDRLRLRMWRLADADAAYRACQDSEIQRWTTVPSPYSRENAVDWIERIIPEGWRAGTDLTWAVATETDEAPVAAIDVGSRPDQAWSVAHIGFWTAPQARGQGVMTWAVRMVARHAFTVLGVQRLEWYANVGNVASRRVAEKAGFTVEGTLRRGLDQRGARVDAWVGSLLPGELR